MSHGGSKLNDQNDLFELPSTEFFQIDLDKFMVSASRARPWQEVYAEHIS